MAAAAWVSLKSCCVTGPLVGRCLRRTLQQLSWVLRRPREGLAASSYCLLPFSSLRPLYLAKSLVNQTIGAGYVCTNLHTSLGTLRKAIKNFICMKACKPSGRRCERILKLKLESRDSEGNSKNPLWQEGQGDQNQQLPKRVGIPTGIFVRTGARRQRPW